MKHQPLITYILFGALLLVGADRPATAQQLGPSRPDIDAPAEPFVPSEQPPRLMGDIQELARDIPYPEMARIANMEGRVVIEFTVDERGRVTNAHPVKPVKWLSHDVLRAIEKLSFEPARQNGVPVPVTMHLPLRFILVDRVNQLK